MTVAGPISKYPSDANELFTGLAMTRIVQVTADPFHVTMPPPESVNVAEILSKSAVVKSALPVAPLMARFTLESAMYK